MQVRAWLAFHDWGGPPSQADVLAELRAAGVEHTSDTAVPTTPGIVMFGAVTPSLILNVHQLSHGGHRRVIAVAERASRLARGAAWQLLSAGAADVLAWDDRRACSDDIAARVERWLLVDQLLSSPEVHSTLVGEHASWRSTLRKLVEVAAFSNASVLITGESGTGKELVARAIHALDRRTDRGEFVVLDCTTVVPTLSGSEFFGHEKGAFTGAVGARDGAFAMADGGTLFLDEVGELPLPLQAELLRVIQEGMYKRVGSDTWRRTNFRLVSATNRDLLHEESLGKFRRDLFFRMAGWSFHLPSLRERRSDIPLFARHFAGGLQFDAAVEDFLTTRDYPGNVRDLRQLIMRIVARHVGPGPITVGDVPPDDRPADPTVRTPDLDFETVVEEALAHGLTLKEIAQLAADTAVRVAMREEDWSLGRAAARLGVTSRALQLRRVTGRGMPLAAPSNPASH